MKTNATFIKLKEVTFTVGDHIVFGCNINTKKEVILKEGYVAFGEFKAETYTCYGFFVADKNGKQISEAGLHDGFVKPLLN